MTNSTERYFSDGVLNTDYMNARIEHIAKQYIEQDRETLAKLLAIRMVEHELRDELDEMRNETNSIENKLHVAERDRDAHKLKTIEDRNKKTIDALYREFLHYTEDSKELWPKVEKHSKTQSARRKDKPAADHYDNNRNDRIKKFHANLIAGCVRDPVKQTAEEFSLDPRTIRRIVNPK